MFLLVQSCVYLLQAYLIIPEPFSFGFRGILCINPFVFLQRIAPALLTPGVGPLCYDFRFIIK